MQDMRVHRSTFYYSNHAVNAKRAIAEPNKTASVAREQLNQATLARSNLPSLDLLRDKPVKVEPVPSTPSWWKKAWYYVADSRPVNYVTNSRPVAYAKTRGVNLLGGYLVCRSGKKQQNFSNIIDRLSGSTHLSKAIHAIVQKWADLLKDLAKEKKWYPSLERILHEGNLTIEKALELVISYMYINIAKKIKQPANGYAKHEGPVSLVDVIGYVISILKAQLPTIHYKYCDAYEKIKDPEQRERRLLEIFSPLVQDFMKVAFPEGMQQIPLRKIPLISHYYLRKLHDELEKEILPALFVELYRSFIIPFSPDHKKSLHHLFNGDSLIKLAELAGQKTGEKIPNLFEGNSADDHLPDFMKLLAQNLAKYFHVRSKREQQELGTWLARQLIELGKSENSDIVHLRSLLSFYIEPFLVHIFTNLSRVPVSLKKLPDALGIILIRLCTIISKFFNNYGNLIESRVSASKGVKADCEKDPALVSLFSNLSRELIEAMGLNKPKKIPIPSFLQNIVVEFIRKFLPGLLLDQYFAIKETAFDETTIHKRLCHLLFDPTCLSQKDVTVEVVTNLHRLPESNNNMYDEFYKHLWETSGTEKIFQTIEKLVGGVACEIVRLIFSHYSIETQETLKSSSNPFMQQTREYLTKLVKSMLLEALIIVLEKNPSETAEKEGEHPKYLLLYVLTQKLGVVLQQNLQGLNLGLIQARSISAEDNKKFQMQAHRLFSNLIKNLSPDGVNLFSRLPLEGLPGSETIKDLLWSVFIETLAPDLVLNLYLESITWHAERQTTKKTLKDHLFGTTHTYQASRVLSQYAGFWLKNYLTESNDVAAKTLLSSLISHFKDLNSIEGNVASAVIDKRFQEIYSIVRENIKKVGESDSEQLNCIWPAVAGYLENYIAKFLSGIASSLHEIETENPDFLVDTAIVILKDTADYFEALNVARKKTGNEDGDLPLLTILGTKIHDGVPLSGKLSEEERSRVRLQGHFIPLASKLLSLSNISVDELPLPAGLRMQVGELLLTKILPSILLEINSKILEHSTRNDLLLIFVDKLHKSLDEVKPGGEEAHFDTSIYRDPKHKKLVETCGNVIHELAGRIPDTWVQYIFMKEKVKKMSAEALGEIMMPHLQNLTLNGLIDKGIFNGLPKFSNGVWKGKEKNERLVPKIPNKNAVIRASEDFIFEFAKSPERKKMESQKHEEESKKTRLVLRDKFSRTIRQQIALNAQEGVKSVWSRLQRHFDDQVKKTFGDRGLKVKEFFDKIARKIFIDFIWGIISSILSAIGNVFGYFLEKGYINKRSDNIIESFHSEALEHLLYKWTDALIDGLLYLKENPRPRLTNEG